MIDDENDENENDDDDDDEEDDEEDEERRERRMTLCIAVIVFLRMAHSLAVIVVTSASPTSSCSISLA